MLKVGFSPGTKNALDGLECSGVKAWPLPILHCITLLSSMFFICFYMYVHTGQ